MGITPKRPTPIKPLRLLPDQGWPEVTGSFKQLKIPTSGLVGVDLEYHYLETPKRPYMAAISLQNDDGTLVCISSEFKRAEEYLKLLYHRSDVKFVGHNVLTADCDVLSKWWGDTPDIPKGGVIDTLIAHYLMNQHLCHASKKFDEENLVYEYERGLGKLGLGSMISQYVLQWAEYKSCRGEALCFGPCPIHDERGYNGLDGGGPILSWQLMLEEAKTFPSSYFPEGVPLQRNHDHLVRTQRILNHMPPIPVHMPTVEALNIQLEKDKNEIFPCDMVTAYSEKTGRELKKKREEWYWGFNPNSPKQVKDYFRIRGVILDKSSPEDIVSAIRRVEKMTNSNIAPDTLEALKRLKKYKALGKGFKSWFDEPLLSPYPGLDDDWKSLNPTWKTFGGAMSRPVTSNPNCQNFPKRGLMKAMRKALKAPPGYKYLKFDEKQGELRVFGYIGGIDPMDMGDDAFSWVVRECDGLFEEVASLARNEYNKVPRNACKQMVHAYDYGEGIMLLEPGAWKKSYLKKAYDAGALLVYEDWTYRDKVVAFNGSNLANRLFGDASFASRAKALAAQKRFAELVPAAMRAQKRIMQDSLKGYVVTPAGILLKLYEVDDRENIKQALAVNGQGTLAYYCAEILNWYADRKYPPVIWIHDEFGMLVPDHWDAKQCADYLHDAEGESALIAGFRCPLDMEWGPSYGELSAIEL